MIRQLFCPAIFFFMVCSLPSYGQRLFLEDIDGRPILEKQYTHVEGTPYLFDDWRVGVVKLKNGTTYKEVLLKYDQVAEELLFSHKGQALTFVDPVSEFRFMDGPVFRSGYGKSFHEVLSDGGTKLIRRRFKQIMESKEYNSASVTRKFVDVENLFLVKGTEVIRIRKDRKSVLSALGDKTGQLETFIRSEKLNLKNEDGIIRLLEYYNTL